MDMAKKLEPLNQYNERKLGQVVCGKCGYVWTPRIPDRRLRRKFRSCPNCFIRLALPNAG